MADHDTIQHLTYDDLGRVVANNRNGTKSDMTYGYDRLHGWITDIRSGGGFEQHLFREAGSFEPKWNGSITAMMWKTPDSDVTRRYDYCYDGLNRLTDAMYCEVTGQSGSSGSGDPNNPQNIIPETLQTEAFDKYSEYASYDKNSNFTSFQRYGMLNNRTYGQTDELAFSYNGNQFKWVDDDTEQTLTYNGAFDFDDGADRNVEYTYNTNGQLTSDANSGISLIQYDMLGNPKKVTMASGDYIEYVYAPDGTKLKASHYTKRTNNTYSCQNTFYRGNMIYEYGSNGYPDKILFPGGYYFYVSADDMMMRDYYVQDYQGNNRMVVHQYIGSDFVGQTTHYYPFGGVIGDICTNQELQDYKYSGKEFDRTYGLDFYDFHARQYDPKVPRFTSIDPKSEDYYGISPYAYCAGDPVNCVDPKGENVCVLIEPDGARGFGHMAILIQHDDQRWYLYSKNGTTEHSGVSGASDKGDQNGGKWKDSNKNLSYSSPEEFLKTQGERDDHSAYTEGYQIETIEGQDKLAIEAAQKELEKDYNLLGSNCAKLVQNSLDAIGKDKGEPHFKLGQTPGSLIGGYVGSVLGIPTGIMVGSLIEKKTPNLIYKRIKQRNSGTTIK